MNFMRMYVLAVSACLVVACGPSVETTGGTTHALSSGGSDGACRDCTVTGGQTSAVSVATSGAANGTGATGGSGETGSDSVGFERFRLGMAAGLCEPEEDCSGLIELLASGRLRVDRFSDPGGGVTEVDISREDFVAAVAVFTDSELIALLSGAEMPCDQVFDLFEDMTVVIGPDTFITTTTLCELQPIAAARETAVALRSEYAPSR